MNTSLLKLILVCSSGHCTMGLIFVFMQIIADIFNTNVYILEGTANSASLGGAYRAKHGLMPEGTPFMDAVRNAPLYKLAVSPRVDKHQV